MTAMKTARVREYRCLGGGELRTEKAAGAVYLVGRAASYNLLSSDLGGWYERILPGAFARALRERQDVRHLINHDPNQVLGRTTSGTLELKSTTKGLEFRTRLGNRSYERDLAESVERGDVNECSFGFIARKSKWVDEPDPDKPGETRCIRELSDLDLMDISSVVYPAYPQTNTALAMRALFDGGNTDMERFVKLLLKAADRIAPGTRPAKLDANEIRRRKQYTLDLELTITK
jgi:HK97 family phage prohead protease